MKNKTVILILSVLANDDTDLRGRKTEAFSTQQGRCVESAGRLQRRPQEGCRGIRSV